MNEKELRATLDTEIDALPELQKELAKLAIKACDQNENKLAICLAVVGFMYNQGGTVFDAFFKANDKLVHELQKAIETAARKN